MTYNYFVVCLVVCIAQEEQKDSLIALARERDEFELCIKELRARNSWLEKQVLGAPDALRCALAKQQKKSRLQIKCACVYR